jgi:hypothetical protein
MNQQSVGTDLDAVSPSNKITHLNYASSSVSRWGHHRRWHTASRSRSAALPEAREPPGYIRGVKESRKTVERADARGGDRIRSRPYCRGPARGLTAAVHQKNQPGPSPGGEERAWFGAAKAFPQRIVAVAQQKLGRPLTGREQAFISARAAGSSPWRRSATPWPPRPPLRLRST